jgi:hypothetical protein
MMSTATLCFTRSLAPCLLNSRGPAASFWGTKSLHVTSVRANTGLTNILGDGPAPAVQVKSAGDKGIELTDGV